MRDPGLLSLGCTVSEIFPESDFQPACRVRRKLDRGLDFGGRVPTSIVATLDGGWSSVSSLDMGFSTFEKCPCEDWKARHHVSVSA